MLPERFEDFKIILASKSPRRKQLLSGLGLNFDIPDLPPVEETWPEGLDKFQIPVWLSSLKSDAFRDNLNENEILITADTIVWFREEVIHKPKGRNDAIDILQKLSGNTHEVLTGVTLRSHKARHSFCSHSEVTFSNLEKDEIEYYIDRFTPYDKAGGYGIQEWIGYVGIKEIHGSFYNVMGLPVERLYRALGEFIDKM